MNQTFLRRVLLADAATSAATGVLLFADGGLLAEAEYVGLRRAELLPA